MSELLKNFLTLLSNDELEDTYEYDLATDEGYEEFMKQISELKKNDVLKNLMGVFDIDTDSLLDDMADIAESIHDNSKEDKEEETKESEQHFTRPSELLDYDHQMQLHKLTQEYIDEMIKPYNNGKLTDEQINDAYAGLYEFAAWIMNK